MIETFKKIKVLVIGETIIDQYIFCEALGKSGKEPVLALRDLNTEEYLGGAAALSRHISPFCNKISLLSMVGEKGDYLNKINLNSEPLDSRKVIITDDHFGNAFVHYQESYNQIRSYFESIDKIQVITGFIGSTHNCETTTLGRSGSDYTASIFGAALNADEIQIWTDVDGILSANPSIVKNANTISNLN